jgi:hypothetical protein
MQSLVSNDIYVEVTIDGKLNLVDHQTGRIVENGAIQDVYPEFEKHKQIELDKLNPVESGEMA